MKHKGNGFLKKHEAEETKEEEKTETRGEEKREEHLALMKKKARKKMGTK